MRLQFLPIDKIMAESLTVMEMDFPYIMKYGEGKCMENLRIIEKTFMRLRVRRDVLAKCRSTINTSYTYYIHYAGILNAYYYAAILMEFASNLLYILDLSVHNTLRINL